MIDDSQYLKVKVSLADAIALTVWGSVSGGRSRHQQAGEAIRLMLDNPAFVSATRRKLRSQAALDCNGDIALLIRGAIKGSKLNVDIDNIPDDDLLAIAGLS